MLRVSIEEDGDFGPVLILSAVPAFGDAKRRVVRVLPATQAELGDAVEELAELEGGLPADAAVIASALSAIARVYVQHPGIAGLSAMLSADAGGARLCSSSVGARH